MKINKGLRYVVYVRKSEERKERQELSHPAQIKAIKEQFPDLNIVKWMEAESKSAFTPGRPIFNEMMDMIERREADAIVAWHPNRLSRNEHDSARITFGLRGPLKDLRFCSYNFDNSAEGIMMLQMVMNQGQYESSKQGREVKRGMKQKATGGERPGQVPQGYIKVPLLDAQGRPIIRPKDNKIITETGIDPERFDLVKKMWQMLLSGVYTAPQIWKIAIEDWGYMTRETKKKPAALISLSGVYRIFNNPFYAGWFLHNSELCEGKYKPMINLEDFDYTQTLLGKKGKPRTGVNGYAFTAMIKCGACSCQIVGKTNTKWVKRDNKMRTYVHYYCTRKSLKRPCNQSVYTTLDKIEADIDAELAKYTILPEFRDLALKILLRNNKLEVKDRRQIYKNQQRRRKQVQAQLDKLVDMRTRDLLDDNEYLKQKNRLKLEMAQADDSLRTTERRADEWIELTEKAFDFATYARIHFRDTKDLKVKRDILMTLGENLTLKDQKLYLTPHKWLVPIGENYPAIETEYLRRVRTNKKATSKVKEAALEQVFDSWRAQWDSNPRHPA